MTEQEKKNYLSQYVELDRDITARLSSGQADETLCRDLCRLVDFREELERLFKELPLELSYILKCRYISGKNGQK